MTLDQVAGAVLVDPSRNSKLRELTELAGLPVRWCDEWPFDAGRADRIVTTIPVPAPHVDRALGVIVDPSVSPGMGEAWPSRTVLLEEGDVAVVSHLAGGSDRLGRVVAVVGMRGGVGTTALAASLARVLSETPSAVALVDTDPVPRLRTLLGTDSGLVWADLAGGEGPLLPHRLEEGLPRWERVHVLTSDGRAGGRERLDAAIRALAASHEVVVVDLGRDVEALGELSPEVVVMVAAGDATDLAAMTRVIGEGCTHIPVIRTGGAITIEEAALRLATAVVPLGTEKGGSAAQTHGTRPGDRPRGALVRAARAVAAVVEQRP